MRLNTRYKYGIDWPGSFSILVDFMSEIENDVKVALAITFEYVEKSSPQAQGYRDVYMRWNYVGTPEPQQGQYNFKSSTWKVPMNGVLLLANGHMAGPPLPRSTTIAWTCVLIHVLARWGYPRRFVHQ